MIRQSALCEFIVTGTGAANRSVRTHEAPLQEKIWDKAMTMHLTVT
jgi:hypothetical protein